MANSMDLERKSSAITLSDMEVFIFPELIYSLVLANIMSPRIWNWRNDPWFEGLERMKPYRRIARLKQYVMDHYNFNLDLDTWGLTTREAQLARFAEFIDAETLAESNALFGYEGDKYYFDIDIRTHFGLDKYDGNIIPYWKTETVEAMDAFAHKPGYEAGAGECVSLATLYAAALFLVAGIPLDQVYLMATPLHSQNFVDIDEGILTNNRRLVTKNMWVNGTALSAQARRALDNERVTIVAHHTGCIHTVYDKATIDPARYAHFGKAIAAYLKTDLSGEIMGNFLRHDSSIQKCFQLRWPRHGQDHYVPAERVFAYEQSGSYRLTDKTRAKLMASIAEDEFQTCPLRSRIVLNDLEAFVEREKIDLDNERDAQRLKEQFASNCLNAEIAIESLIRFCRTRPRLPDVGTKTFCTDQAPLGIQPGMTREAVIERLESIRASNRMADLAFYVYRDLNRTEPEPYLMAAMQRNPVSIEASAGLDLPALQARLDAMDAQSIYDEEGRMAQPDEVWNYNRGDGAEKAVLLANILRSRDREAAMRVEIEPTQACLKTPAGEYRFASTKRLREQTWNV